MTSWVATIAVDDGTRSHIAATVTIGASVQVDRRFNGYWDEITAALDAIFRDAERGVRACKPGPLPSEEEPFDRSNKAHLRWAWEQLHGLETMSGRIRVYNEPTGERNPYKKAPPQPVY